MNGMSFGASLLLGVTPHLNNLYLRRWFDVFSLTHAGKTPLPMPRYVRSHNI